ncbi:hypothetical protein ACH414_12425 [Streptomyces sp. NPDC020422]|uniref:hypothetical protein n=1 Tax=Streptomyces sp. NPDC020422 TaxID=3365074 RepID=UPI00379D3E22
MTPIRAPKTPTGNGGPGPALRTACLSLVLALAAAEFLAATPFQIDWADSTGRVGYHTPLSARLRYLTVSPVFLYGVGGTVRAAFGLVLWTAVFALVLTLGARALAHRSAEPGARVGVFLFAVLVLAPPANAVAWIVPLVPSLVREPVGRGEVLTRALIDVQDSTGHAMALALVAALCAGLAHTAAHRRASRRGSAEAPAGTEAPEPPTLRGVLLQLAVLLRGPSETLWRRIGLTLLMTCGACVLLKLLASPGTEDVLSALARPFCQSDGDVRLCSKQLGSVLQGDVPDNSPSPVVPPVYFAYASLYALQGFALLFAMCVFLLTAQTELRRTPATTFLMTCWGYVFGTVTYGVLLEVGLAAGQGEPVGLSALPGLLPRLLVPPPTLSHTLFAAPVAAGVFALCHRTWIRLRSREARRPDGERTPSGRFT